MYKLYKNLGKNKNREAFNGFVTWKLLKIDEECLCNAGEEVRLEWVEE